MADNNNSTPLPFVLNVEIKNYHTTAKDIEAAIRGAGAVVPSDAAWFVVSPSRQPNKESWRRIRNKFTAEELSRRPCCMNFKTHGGAKVFGSDDLNLMCLYVLNEHAFPMDPEWWTADRIFLMLKTIEDYVRTRDIQIKYAHSKALLDFLQLIGADPKQIEQVNALTGEDSKAKQKRNANVIATKCLIPSDLKNLGALNKRIKLYLGAKEEEIRLGPLLMDTVLTWSARPNELTTLFLDENGMVGGMLKKKGDARMPFVSAVDKEKAHKLLLLAQSMVKGKSKENISTTLRRQCQKNGIRPKDLRAIGSDMAAIELAPKNDGIIDINKITIKLAAMRHAPMKNLSPVFNYANRLYVDSSSSTTSSTSSSTANSDDE